jgi:hypothetical protein
MTHKAMVVTADIEILLTTFVADHTIPVGSQEVLDHSGGMGEGRKLDSGLVAGCANGDNGGITGSSDIAGSSNIADSSVGGVVLVTEGVVGLADGCEGDGYNEVGSDKDVDLLGFIGSEDSRGDGDGVCWTEARGSGCSPPHHSANSFSSQ